jgi:hypothetical protein
VLEAHVDLTDQHHWMTVGRALLRLATIGAQLHPDQDRVRELVQAGAQPGWRPDHNDRDRFALILVVPRPHPRVDPTPPGPVQELVVGRVTRSFIDTVPTR